MQHRDLRALEPSFEELMDARERADAGIRTALPELAERIGLGSEGEPETAAGAEVDHETAIAVARRLANAHDEIFEAAKELPLAGHMDLHLAFNSMINELNRVSGELAERWGDE